MEAGDMERLVKAVERLQQSSDRLYGLGNNANSTFNSGGIGLWIAVTCCVVMLALSICMGAGLAVQVLRDAGFEVTIVEHKKEK